MPCCNNIIINAGFTTAQKLAFGQLTMQQLHILHYTFRFTTAHIVINCALKYALHYNTLSFTCGLRTVYLINLINLICVDIVKCQVKFCLLPDFLHRFAHSTALTTLLRLGTLSWIVTRDSQKKFSIPNLGPVHQAEVPRPSSGPRPTG